MPILILNIVISIVLVLYIRTGSLIPDTVEEARRRFHAEHFFHLIASIVAFGIMMLSKHSTTQSFAKAVQIFVLLTFVEWLVFINSKRRLRGED